MKRIFTSLFAFALLLSGLGFGAGVNAQTITPLSQLNPGDLFRTVSSPAVYYMGADGTRYVFPNSSTYFTWYSDFDNVKTIADANIFQIALGGNVTYRPGTRMVKVISIPDTYIVDKGGVLRHVANEAVAIELFGANWNQMIDDLPDSFFPNYSIGAPVASSADFSVSGAQSASPDINTDKALLAPADVEITANGFVPELVVISPGQTVRFNNSDSVNHTATADSLRWGTGTMKPGDVYLRRFDDEGFHTYFDSLNPQLTGTISVE